MRHATVLLALSLSTLTGCQSAICPLLGFFAGQFEGDKTGDLTIDVVENRDDEDKADAEIHLSAPPLDVFGSAVIECENGKISTRLETEEDSMFGTFDGLLGEAMGDGEWSFNTGEQGTWVLEKMD